jgi:phosphoribosylanthranilate isomerase
MHRTRVKICGITRPEDGLAAAHAGADAVGLVFHPASPRFIDLPAALAVRKALPPFVSTVALFVDAGKEEIERVVTALQPTLLQFHGDEDALFCASFGRPYLKAVAVHEGMAAADLLQCERRFSSAAALLLDHSRPGQRGGTGQSFDWSVIPTELAPRIVLAGGLNSGNVADAVRSLRPWAVDVSSGVESSPGVKDHGKIAAFLDQVRRADASS